MSAQSEMNSCISIEKTLQELKEQYEKITGGSRSATRQKNQAAAEFVMKAEELLGKKEVENYSDSRGSK